MKSKLKGFSMTAFVIAFLFLSAFIPAADSQSCEPPDGEVCDSEKICAEELYIKEDGRFCCAVGSCVDYFEFCSSETACTDEETLKICYSLCVGTLEDVGLEEKNIPITPNNSGVFLFTTIALLIILSIWFIKSED